MRPLTPPRKGFAAMRESTTAVEQKFAKILAVFESLTAHQQTSVLKALTALKKSVSHADSSVSPIVTTDASFEARQNERSGCSIEVSYTADDHFCSERIRNISGGGIYIETSKIIAPGKKLSLTFSIPNTRHNFKLNGVVVRSTQGGIGVKFEDITQHQRELLDYIVKTRNRHEHQV